MAPPTTARESVTGSNAGPVAVVVGVGAGLGAALARRFAEGYRVGLVAQPRGTPVV